MFLFAPIRWSIRLAEYFVLAIIVYVIATGVQVVLASRASSDPTVLAPADAVLVFAAPVSSNGPGPVLLGRLAQALALFKAKDASNVIVSGPSQAGGALSITAVGSHWLSANGVPASDVRSIISSNNTTAISQARGLLGPHSSAIVVTDAMDALWARGDGANSGLSVEVSPPQSSKIAFYSEFGSLLRQGTGVAAGRIVGYGRAFWADN